MLQRKSYGTSVSQAVDFVTTDTAPCFQTMASLAGGFPDIFNTDTQMFWLTNAGKKKVIWLSSTPRPPILIFYSLLLSTGKFIPYDVGGRWMMYVSMEH